MSHSDKKNYLSSPHMGVNEQKFITDAFETNWISPIGPNVDEFERELASYVNVQGSLAVSSGTSAIHLALRLLGLGREILFFVQL
jgi:pyridoxal phosphate-dependent aminotransferase EpsN